VVCFICACSACALVMIDGMRVPHPRAKLLGSSRRSAIQRRNSTGFPWLHHRLILTDRQVSMQTGEQHPSVLVRRR